MSKLGSMLLAVCATVSLCLLPGETIAQTDSTAGPPQASAEDQGISPAVAAQLDALKKRVEQLEKELQMSKGIATDANTPAVPPTPDVAPSAQAIVENGTTPAPSAPEKPAAAAPFSDGDWSWLNGNSRVKDIPFDSKFFTPEIRSDVSYIYDFNHPADDTIGGSSEVFRANEFQLTQLGVGGDFHWDNVRARLMTQFGMYSVTTPRNDASPSRGQWDLADAYRYVSEAYGGYHLDVLHGINIDAGIFMSYVGLFSYYNFDNWAYQPSFVSSNTPWFFNGMRIQIFPTKKLKIEPWFVNGWQSYGRPNGRPGIGGQILYRPSSNWSLLGNQYAVGQDDVGITGRTRYHTDDSVEYKYYEDKSKDLDRAAFSLTVDAGCESGAGVACFNGTRAIPKQTFLGFMFYNRVWLDKDKFGVTIGGGAIDNPGRYLVLLPPINGATASSGTPYFPESPGDSFRAWDASATFDYMPKQYITFRWEYDHRASNVPYWSGSGGITPPGGNTGAPGSVVSGWYPDLVKRENRLNMAILVMF